MRNKKDKPAEPIQAAPTAVVGMGHSGRHFGKRAKIVLIGSIILLLICFVAYYFSSNKKQAVNNSCANDKEFIARYNEVMQRRGATKLKEIDQDLEKKDTTNDATCKYMLLMLQFGDAENHGEVDTYKQLKQLESRGKSISKDINDGVDRKDIDGFFKIKLDNEGNTENGEG